MGGVDPRQEFRPAPFPSDPLVRECGCSTFFETHGVNCKREVTRALTLGEKRVGVRFNPSGSLAVDIIKREGADLIDIINDLGGPGNSQFQRWKAEALTCIETGIMYAVKAATAGMEPEDG